MATPDLTEYVDLRFFDKDPQDIFDSALLTLQTRLPEWTPREGNVEVVLLEAMALQVAEAIFAVNRLPGAVVMALMRLYGIEPDSGAQPTTTLRFVIGHSLGQEIPEGTAARLDLSGGLEPVVFETTEALSIAPGASEGTVVATGDRFTVEANGYPSSTLLDLVDSISSVDRVELASVVVAGDDPESDEMWIERAVQRLARLSETLVLPKHFETYSLENAAVTRARAFDNWNGSTGAPGDHAGHVTVAVYGDGTPLSGPAMTTLEGEMEAIAQANLDVHVIAPTVTTVPVTSTVKALPGYTSSDVQAAVAAALQAFLDPSEWDWSTTVRRNELIAVIGNVEGVDYVTTLTTPASDQVLTGTAALATAGTITTTVT